MRGSTTFSKRLKEQQRLEKRQAKEAKRVERKKEKETGQVSGELSDELNPVPENSETTEQHTEGVTGS